MVLALLAARGGGPDKRLSQAVVDATLILNALALVANLIPVGHTDGALCLRWLVRTPAWGAAAEWPLRWLMFLGEDLLAYLVLALGERPWPSGAPARGWSARPRSPKEGERPRRPWPAAW